MGEGEDGVMKKFLPEVCTIQYGFPFDSAKFSDSEGIPLIRIRDVVRGYSETFTTEEYKDEFLVHENDLLVGMDGEFNIAKWGKTPALLNQRVCRLMPKTNIDNGYLFYFMPTALKKIEEKTPFVTVKHLSAKELNKVEIPILPFDEQKKIATVLDKVSDLISLRKQQLTKLDELVKARFVEMFTANESNFPMTALNDLCKEIFAGGDKPSEMSQIQTDEFEFPVYANGYENLGLQGFAKNYRVEEKSVTISARGTIGYSFIREGRYTPIVRLITAVPGDKLNVVYLKYSIDMLDIKSSGTSQAQLTVPNFKKMKIMEPPLPLQNEFAVFVERVDQQKQTIQQSLEKLELMKKALMQEYFG